jgi:hypothetical protein
MFSNTFSFLSSRNFSDQVSHPYKTTRKIIVLCNNVVDVDKLYRPANTVVL